MIFTAYQEKQIPWCQQTKQNITVSNAAIKHVHLDNIKTTVLALIWMHETASNIT
jgi:hypothetical protein